MAHPIRTELEDNGILIVTFDAKSARVNTIDPAFTAEFARLVEMIETDASVKGVILTSAKSTFVVGGDLNSLGALAEKATGDPQDLLDTLSAFPKLLRRLETLKKPVVAAINGTAMGGGLEIALAAHHRIVAELPNLQLGLPEVKVGLMPGAGGTQRLPRLIGIIAAAPLLLEGRSLSPEQAHALGLVEAVVVPDKLLDTARAILTNSPRSVQPWDERGFEVPGGSNILDLKWTGFYYGANGQLQARTMHNYPAPKAILSAIYEGCMLTIDAGLDIEARYMATLFQSPVAGAMIRSLFINKQRADRLAFRPDVPERLKVKSLGVIGAGMMGVGIAQVAASRGIQVVLIDRDESLARKAKDGLTKRLSRQVEKGRLEQSLANDWLERITPSAAYSDLKGCELVIEAVFEDVDIKADVTAGIEAAIADSAIVATNTSTLRISALARSSKRPANFIGLHFFSPVDRMPLVEIICGAQTSETTLAKAMDFVRQIGKTPITVNDAWGFYTSRSFATFTNEAMCMLEEGVAPALIENAACFAGMPVGPLTVQDEVSLELSYNVMNSLRRMRASDYVETASDRVICQMVEQEGRRGRRYGSGFYEYPEGQPKRLWPDLQALYPVKPEQPGVAEVKERLLFRQALEAARCLDEGVLNHPEDADLGALLGWNFPSYTGGPISLIDTIGTGEFVSRCQAYAERLGDRFVPPQGLIEKAKNGQSYYQG